VRLSQQIDDMLTLWPENGTRWRWREAYQTRDFYGMARPNSPDIGYKISPH
jgi:hypothetical protein